jgi:sugar phosphate isomerase/epimerase
VNLARLSINQRTVASLDVPTVADACVRHGIGAVGLWREPVAEYGLHRSARLVADLGLRVSSLCRGGFLTSDDPDAYRAALDDNRRAIHEAATLGARCLILVVGGLPPGSRDLDGARQRVLDAIDVLAPEAAAAGVRLALEPMHPIFCADRGVLSTLRQAIDWAQRFPVQQVGVVVDTYHVWWDPELFAQIARAGDRIASYQISDWVVPLPQDNLLGRAMPGDGHIDFPSIHAAVTAAGYAGDIEVEIFNGDIWAAPPDPTLATISERFTALLR